MHLQFLPTNILRDQSVIQYTNADNIFTCSYRCYDRENFPFSLIQPFRIFRIFLNNKLIHQTEYYLVVSSSSAWDGDRTAFFPKNFITFLYDHFQYISLPTKTIYVW